jgi:hypothetical protein
MPKFGRLFGQRPLEQELERKLADARIACGADDPKTGAGNPGATLAGTAGDAGAGATRGYELGVIERVKKLRAELEVHSLVYRELFQQRHIPVIDSWAVKITPLRVPQLA